MTDLIAIAAELTFFASCAIAYCITEVWARRSVARMEAESEAFRETSQPPEPPEKPHETIAHWWCCDSLRRKLDPYGVCPLNEFANWVVRLDLYLDKKQRIDTGSGRCELARLDRPIRPEDMRHG